MLQHFEWEGEPSMCPYLALAVYILSANDLLAPYTNSKE
jgi:hypothetical protein